MEREVVRAKPDVQFLRLLDRFDHRWRHARHALDGRLDAVGGLDQDIEVIAMHLNRDLGIDARHHVADEVGKRLLHFDRHTRHFAAKLGKQIRDDLVTVPA